eukprot:TRINITY_DN54666_c0_g1_i1.p1 TRINITY_DN54666_c0_g1~~TRINITY_DN54666_c0_g1_i1.p1  ORF type:complete len:312 (+),score=43.34 TRINITY_DN54666_c0_g1_i1:72-1007(+)
MIVRLVAAVVACATRAAAVMFAYPRNEGRTVCISLAAYEEPAFIDALLSNIDHFMEKDTKVALHLNARTEYSEEDLSRWNGRIPQGQGDVGRSRVSKERLAVEPFMGSVMAAHLINARTMEKEWPGQCAYFLIQASNMMWVKKGAEAVVREHEYSRINLVDAPWGHTADHPFTAELSPDGKLFGWAISEGSYYPMTDVIDFNARLDRYLEANGTTLKESLEHCYAYFEESWLPTYALNFGSKYSLEKKDSYEYPMCFRAMNYDIVDDGMSVDQVKEVLDPANREMQHFYAVKRVSRHVDSPGTQFIMSLSS